MPRKSASKQASDPGEYGGAQIVGVQELPGGFGLLVPAMEVFNLQDALIRFSLDPQNGPHSSAGEKSAALLRIDSATARVTVHRGTWDPPYAVRGRAASKERRERRKAR